MTSLPATPGQASLPGGRGKGLYPVGPTEVYKEIQEAIDALVADQGSEPFTATQKITVAAGVYEPFRIEPDSLRPTSDYRLIIEREPDTTPVVSGRKRPSKSQVGCLIGNNIPYVTVSGLFFRDLIKGIVVGVNSHRPIVNKCTFLDCGNAAVWFYQCDEGLLANSVIINNDHGFVATLTKGFALLHNTFFNDTGFSREEKKSYCIFMELQDDRGQGVENTGLAYIYNNIVYSLSDFGILLYEKDVLNIRADHNDWYCPNNVKTDGVANGGLAEIRERVLDTVSRDFVTKLVADDITTDGDDWRTRVGQDRQSISEDPIFIKPTEDGSEVGIDLTQLKDSPVIDKGSADASVLPVWITDLTVIAFDNRGRSRKLSAQGPCAIGAYQTNISKDWNGSNLFANGNSEALQVDGEDVIQDLDTDCDTDAFSFDRAASTYANSVPVWFPKVHSGTFFIRDASYHLYVEKQGVYIRDMRRTTFALPARVVSIATKVFVAGRDVTTQTPWILDGYTFTLYHSGLDFEYAETSDVEIETQYRYWESSADGFATRTMKQRWKLNEGFTEHVFPTDPYPGSPVVVTDDLIEPGNLTGLCQEFRTVYDSVRDETHLEFGGPKNLWPNSDFAYTDEGGPSLTGIVSPDVTGYLPWDHRIEAPSADIGVVHRFITTTGLEVSPIRGDQMLVIGPGSVDNFVEQRLRIDPERPYVFTAHAAAISPAPASIKVSLDFIDHNREVKATYGPLNAHLPGNTGPQAQWVRFGFGFYREASQELGLAPFADHALELHTGIYMPVDAEEVLIRMHPGTGTVPVVVDAVQLEVGYRPGLYTRIPNGTDLTVEYETSDRKFYKVSDLTMQPIRNAHARGFLSIVPAPARQWDPSAFEYATTVTDQWAWGRVHLLPWAKLSGFGNKYIHSPTFSTEERLSPDEPVSLTPAVAMPADIKLEPAVLVARQGSEGEVFSVEVIDQYKNPYAFERLRASIIDPTGEFPGYLAMQEWGFFTKLGQQVTARLDEAGTAVLRWVPPESEDIEYRGPKPTIQSTVVAGTTKRTGYVDTYYRVNPANHGNVTLRDHLANKIDLVGPAITGQFAGIFGEDYTIISLPDYPVPGSVEVFASRTGEIASTRLLECFSVPVPSRHFNVNYEEARILVAGTWEYDFRIEYARRLGFVNPSFPRRIYFDGSALDQLTGDIAAVQYDAAIDLILEALPPTGIPESTKSTYLRVNVVAQHNDREVTT